MTVITEGTHSADFILHEGGMSYSRDTITIASGVGIVAPGTVLGKITASGKFIPAPAAGVVGSEGAEVGVAISIHGVDATSADVATVAVARYAVVNANQLTYDTSVNTDPEKAAKVAELKAVGILAR